MGSFSDLFCLRPESLCGCGWEKFLISLWEPRRRIFEGVWWKLSQVPPLHMGLSKRGRAFEPWEKNHDTSSINLWCSISSSQKLQRPHLVFSPSPHPTGESPWGRVWFDLRSTRLFNLQLFCSWKPLPSLLPAGTGWFCVFSTPPRFPEMGVWY